MQQLKIQGKRENNFCLLKKINKKKSNTDPFTGLPVIEESTQLCHLWQWVSCNEAILSNYMFNR